MKSKFHVGQLVNVVHESSVKHHCGIGVVYWREARESNPHMIVRSHGSIDPYYELKDNEFSWPEYGLEEFEDENRFSNIDDLI